MCGLLHREAFAACGMLRDCLVVIGHLDMVVVRCYPRPEDPAVRVHYALRRRCLARTLHPAALPTMLQLVYIYAAHNRKLASASNTKSLAEQSLSNRTGRWPTSRTRCTTRPVLQEVLAPRYPGRRRRREGRDDRGAVLLRRSMMLAEGTEPIAARPFSRLRPQMAASHLPGLIALPGLMRYTDCAYWFVPPAGLRFCTGTTKVGGRPTASSTPGEHEIRSGSYRRTDFWCHYRCPALTSSIF
ncbi:hypothetical protein CMUS01_05829 [Colletotrichum musicola]|uniref:Uncharacterized protein n=1 Tax=Colletotrichum musicola TaxID=2175873 RepID=A0A8H6KQ03_9PEZI|nr:hypothetical protein CMUS01_05829 [Colletotrichum musicola]